MSRKYRVVHAGTGYVGQIALKVMLQQPNLELVGHHVHSPEKAGKDTGEWVAGNPKTGVITTNDWADVIKLKPDVLTYFFDSVRREREAMEELAQVLEAGINVVCISAWGTGHRKTVPADILELIDKACAKGNSSLFFNGCDPGWSTSDLVIAALGPANRVDSIRMVEYASFAKYTAEYACREYFGFGKPMGFQPILAQGGLIEEMWAPTLHRVADALGVELDGFKTVYETDSVDYDLNVACGLIPAGTASVVHFELQGLYKGRQLVTLEHLDHLFADVGEYKNNRWTKPGTPGTAYRIEVSGDPSYALELHSHSSDINVTPILNCIPALVAAKPGLLHPLDLDRYWSSNITAKVGPWP